MAKILAWVLLLWAGWHLYDFAHQPLPIAMTPVNFAIKPNSSLTHITEQLQAYHVLPQGKVIAEQFSLLARLTGQSSHLKAGFYQLTQAVTPLQLLTMLAKGQGIVRKMRFTEGWTFLQMRVALNMNPWIHHDTHQLSDAQIAQLLDMPSNHLEGWFFPDTYDIAVDSTDMDILRRAHDTMQRRLQQAWLTRAQGLPYANAEQALVMASIIEKETADPDERSRIAAVFINRLHQGMRLQTDPTVIYGLGVAYHGNLHKTDLQYDTPYNTYTRFGLPPTPIAMPGMAAIDAALHPVSSNELYFVSRGDGTHFFSSRLVDHNQAVARYQKHQ